MVKATIETVATKAHTIARSDQLAPRASRAWASAPTNSTVATVCAAIRAPGLRRTIAAGTAMPTAAMASASAPHPEPACTAAITSSAAPSATPGTERSTSPVTRISAPAAR